MGFNIQGVAISKKYNTVEDLVNELGIGGIQKVGETYFEEASSSAIEDNDVFITEVANGTLITLGTGFDIQEISLSAASKGGKALRFMVGETAMVFAFEYFKDGQSQRNILHAEGINMMEEGEPLEIEIKEADLTEIIFSLISNVAGDSIYSIEPDHKSEHYSR